MKQALCKLTRGFNSKVAVAVNEDYDRRNTVSTSDYRCQQLICVLNSLFFSRVDFFVVCVFFVEPDYGTVNATSLVVTVIIPCLQQVFVT